MPEPTPSPHLDNARQAVATAAAVFDSARQRLAALEDADPVDQSRAAWVIDHDTARQEVLEAATALAHAKLAELEADTIRRRQWAAELDEAIPGLRSERHQHAETVERLTAELGDAVGNLIDTVAEEARLNARLGTDQRRLVGRTRRIIAGRLAYLLADILPRDLVRSVGAVARTPLTDTYPPTVPEAQGADHG